MAQAQDTSTAQAVVNPYKNLRRFLELASEALASGDKFAFRDYATTACFELMILDLSLDDSCGRLAAEAHEIFLFMIIMIDSVIEDVALAYRLSNCLDIASILFEDWEKTHA